MTSNYRNSPQRIVRICPQVNYRDPNTTYHFTALPRAMNGKARLTIDWGEQTGPNVSLVDDEQPHSVEVRI